MAESSDSDVSFTDDSDSDVSETEAGPSVPNCDDESEDDEVVRAIKLAQQKKPSIRPPDIKLDSTPCNINFHPVEDMLVVGDFDGNIRLFSYTTEDTKELKKINLEEDVVSRDIKFTSDGTRVCTLCNDSNLVIYHTDGMQVERKIEDISEESPMSLCIVDENVYAVGDEEGYVHAWDRRMSSVAFSHKVAEDAITSILADTEGKVMVASSSDGSISSVKVRAKKVQTQSEPYDQGFNCMGTLKQDTKLVVGDEVGKMYLFNWGEFGYHSDEYHGYKGAINCMIPITEKIMLTGCEDGAIRAVHFFPMKFCGIIGKHKDSVQSMDICNDGHLIASICLDEVIRFWNVSFLESFVLPSRLKKATKETKAKDLKHHLPSSRQANAKEFFAGLDS